ncbi:MAG: hypothetical protein WCP56_01500 [Candidatus Saccharibacteria bacterium]
MNNTEIYTSHIQINYTPKKSTSDSGESVAIGFEPYEKESSTAGNLYLLIEQNSPNDKINFDSISKICGESFYDNSQDTSVADRFKSCLKSINAALGSSNAGCSIAIVAIDRDRMLFSNIGQATILHIRKGIPTSLSTKKIHSSFKEIGQGTIKSKDQILIVSQEIRHNINISDLGQMASRQSADKFLEQLHLSLPEDNETSYSSLLITASDTKVHQVKSEDVDNNEKTKMSDAKFKALMLGIKKSINEGGTKAKASAKKIKSNYKSKMAPEITTKTKNIWTAFWSKYINPNPKQAIIVVFSTILIIIAILWTSSVLSAKPQAFSQLQKAEVLISTAQSSLAKNNQASAQENINKAKDLLGGISKADQQKLDSMANSDKIKYGFSTLLKNLNAIEDKLGSITRIATKDSFTISQSNLASMVWLNSSLFGLSTQDGAIVEINPLLGQPITRASSSDLKQAIAMDSLNDSGLVVLTKTGLFQYTSDKGLQKIIYSPFPGINDVSSYLNNIYLLSPDNGQVIRYAKSGLNLSAKTSILKNTSASQLSKSTSLSVNGNIFISSANTILLFEQGAERSYKISNLPSSFGNIKDMYLNSEAGYFILLNSDSNRLALLSTGPESADFIRLYALESDSKINSFAVEPKSSQININSGNKIFTYKIEK